MKRRLIALSLALFLCAALTSHAFAQTTSHQTDVTLESSKEKKETTTKVKIRNTVSNKFETEDGDPLIEKANNFFETKITIESGKMKYFGSTGFATSAHRFNTVGKFSVGAGTEIKGVDLSMQGITYFSQHRKLGDIRAEASKSFKPNKHGEFRPFANLSYILPLESGHSNVSRGWVGRVGLRYEQEFENHISLETKFQGMFNSGAVFEGRRAGIGCESELQLPIPNTKGRFKLGPTFGFVYYPGYHPMDHEMKNRSVSFGFAFTSAF